MNPTGPEKRITAASLFWIVMAAWLITDLIFLRIAGQAWWDAGVYAGMGKFMFSGGRSGMWEVFRPLLWPMILGLIWKAGLNPAVWGIGLECASGIALVALVYLIGEELYPSAGLFAAVIAGWTPILIFFTSVQITDVPSALLAVLAVYFILKQKPGASGLAAGAAFLLRFPAGLIALPIFLFLLIRKNAAVRDGVVFAATFLIFPVLYIISNAVIYGHLFTPLIMAYQSSISGSANTNPFFYIQGLFWMNPFVAFALVSIASYAIRFKEERRGSFTLVALSLFLTGLYFSLSIHKEIRYALAFLPYLAIAAGLGLALCLKYMKAGRKTFIGVAACIPLVLVVISIAYIKIDVPALALTPQYAGYYDFFSQAGTATVISSSPQISLFSDVKNAEIFDTPQDFASAVSRWGTSTEYVAIDTCGIAVKNASEQESLNSTIAELSSTAIKKYDAISIGSASAGGTQMCSLLIFQTP